MLYRSILPTHRSLDTPKCVSAASTLPSLSRFLVNQSNLDGLAGLAAGQDHSIGHRPDIQKKKCVLHFQSAHPFKTLRGVENSSI